MVATLGETQVHVVTAESKKKNEFDLTFISLNSVKNDKLTQLKLTNL